jgi:hypothetical protein
LRDVDTMRPVDVKRTLVEIGVDTHGVNEASELRAMLKGRMPDMCVICQGEATYDECFSFLPCSHSFHYHCIHKWAQEDFSALRTQLDIHYKPRCPLCVKNLF